MDKPNFSSWHVYWADLKPDAATKKLLTSFDHLSLFLLHFDSKNHVVPAAPEAFDSVTLPGKWGLPTYITVVNDQVGDGAPRLKDPALVHDLLATPEARKDHIERLLTYAEKGDGLEIDYENVWTKDREAFSIFIAELGKELHKRKKRLSVVVQPKNKEVTRDGPGAFDWKKIGKSADLVKVMAYHLHYPGGEPGSVATIEWLQGIAEYGLQEVPVEKFCVALTLSGFDWQRGDGARAADYESSQAKATGYKRKINRDQDGTPYFNYTLKNAAHQVWFEDAVSLNAKVDALRLKGVRHVAFWRLGTGDPRFWRALQKASKNQKR